MIGEPLAAGAVQVRFSAFDCTFRPVRGGDGLPGTPYTSRVNRADTCRSVRPWSATSVPITSKVITPWASLGGVNVTVVPLTVCGVLGPPVWVTLTMPGLASTSGDLMPTGTRTGVPCLMSR